LIFFNQESLPTRFLQEPVYWSRNFPKIKMRIRYIRCV
jgi:hypothetical protein